MSIPAFSVRNHVLVNMLMLVILFSGLAFAFTLTREMFPESRPDKLTIMAFYPGVQPEELEKAITIKVEEAVRDVDGIEKVDSQVSEGLSLTILTLLNEVDDPDTVLQEVKNEIDALEDLPDDLEKITINKTMPRLPVISIALFGNNDEAALKRAVRDLRDDLLSLDGISEIEITGTRDDEISVEIQPNRLLKFNVTFDEVATAIRNSNLDVSGGQLKGNRSTVAVRTLGEKTRGDELDNLVIRSQPDGRKIVLSDVATIRDSFVESDLETLFNGKTGVNVVAYAARNQDAIRISSQVKAFVAGKKGEEFKPSWSDSGAIGRLLGKPDLQKVYDDSRANPFDHAFDYELHSDVARFVEGRLELLTRNGQFGLLLVLISLNLFLNWRVALWAAVGLVVSFLGTFVVMWLLGASINLLSMFGLIIVLGIIVDDAIVIGENIYRHVEEGMPPMQAAVKGAEEVMWPVTIAVLTTIGAFAPMFFIKGQIGDFMRELPIVVIAALSISLLEALVILPAHLSHMPARKTRKAETNGSDKHPHSRTGRTFFGKLGHWQDGIMTNLLAKPYEAFLRLALRWRYVTVAAAVACLVMSIGLVAGGIVEYRFVQKMDSESIICNLEMPVGTSVENLRQQLQLLTNYIVNKDEFPEVVNVQTMIARQYDVTGAGAVGLQDQSHLGQLVLEICPADERTRSSEELVNKFRKYSLESLSGLNSVKWQEMNGGPGGNDIEIKISGDDINQLSIVMDEIKQILSRFDGVFDLDDNLDRGKRELRLRLRDAARPTGITVGMLGSHVRAAMFGAEARRLTRNREDVKIMVRYPEEFRDNAWNLESMWIPTSNVSTNRKWVPISEIAEVESAASYSTIIGVANNER
jgi:HAE1 family hydrophobic/amphiphilic exporter-1